MLGLSGLIDKFQERLEISREEATWRIIGLIFFSFCFIATMAVPILFFPYHVSFIEEIPLLPLSGVHNQVGETREGVWGEVFVGKDKFIEFAKDNQFFVCLNRDAVVYMTEVDGVSYCYEHIVPVGLSYFISSQRIQDGFVIREIEKDKVFSITMYIGLPLAIMIIVLLLIALLQIKGVYEEGAGKLVYKKVWFGWM